MHALLSFVLLFSSSSIRFVLRATLRITLVKSAFAIMGLAAHEVSAYAICWHDLDRRNPPDGRFASPYCKRAEVKETWEKNLSLWCQRTGLRATDLNEPNYDKYVE